MLDYLRAQVKQLAHKSNLPTRMKIETVFISQKSIKWLVTQLNVTANCVTRMCKLVTHARRSCNSCAQVSNSCAQDSRSQVVFLKLVSASK